MCSAKATAVIAMKIFVKQNQVFVLGQTVKPVLIAMQAAVVFLIQLKQSDDALYQFISHIAELHEYAWACGIFDG